MTDTPPSRRVEVIARETVYQGFFRMESLRLRHETFAGGMSAEMTREVMERGHAVAVLLYDPDRDEVVMIEQFRPGPLVAGWEPWMLEVVAGIVEDGETPEEVARREAVEEAGIAVIELEPILRYVPTPGVCSETILLYVGRVNAEGAGGIHGLDEENEDIRAVVMPADELTRLAAAGALTNATTLIAAQWLALNRDSLRRRWPTAGGG